MGEIIYLQKNELPLLGNWAFRGYIKGLNRYAWEKLDENEGEEEWNVLLVKNII